MLSYQISVLWAHLYIAIYLEIPSNRCITIAIVVSLIGKIYFIDLMLSLCNTWENKIGSKFKFFLLNPWFFGFQSCSVYCNVLYEGLPLNIWKKIICQNYPTLNYWIITCHFKENCSGGLFILSQFKVLVLIQRVLKSLGFISLEGMHNSHTNLLELEDCLLMPLLHGDRCQPWE